ncbi:MAG: hypothetical protein IKR94_12375 [Bacteroidales bacterium]|nr:hypothetical protein [Bacteroidales bacterium]
MSHYKAKGNSIITALLLTVVITNCVSAQNPVAKAYTDSNFVEFGCPAKYSISVKVKGGQKVEFPVFQNDIVTDLEVVNGPILDTIYNPDLTIDITNSYLITSFKDSTFTIPQMPVLVDGQMLRTDSVSITFTLLQNIDSTFYASIDTTKTLKIFDIVEVKNTPFTFEEFWHRFGHIIIIVLISMLVAAAITYFIIRKIKNKPIIPIAKPKEPAHITAYRLLDKLKDSKLWQQGRVKDFYSVLTEILKNYITDRYNCSVIENTSEETLDELKQFISPKDENYKNFKTLLDTADFVKFAKFEPRPDENDFALSVAYQFVDNTKLIPEITTQQPSTNAVVPPSFVEAPMNSNNDYTQNIAVNNNVDMINQSVNNNTLFDAGISTNNNTDN